MIFGSIPSRCKRLPLLKPIQAGCGSHPASYWMYTVVHSGGVKATGVFIWLLSSIYCRMSGAKLLLHLYAFMAWTGTNTYAVRHWQPFWSTISVRFIDQCWYFNPQWTPVRAIIKAGCVGNCMSQLGQMRIYRVLTYTSGLLDRCLEVEGGGGPYCWFHKETLTLKFSVA
jgi:hypothetical protein